MKAKVKKIRFKVGDKLVGKAGIRNNSWIRVAKNKWKATENDNNFDDDGYAQQLIDKPSVGKIYDFVPAPSRKRKSKAKPQAKLAVKQPLVRLFHNQVNGLNYLFVGDKGICIGSKRFFLGQCSISNTSLVELTPCEDLSEVMNLLRSIK